MDQLGRSSRDSRLVAGSIGFTVYVSRIGSYDKIYGSLGALIVLLLWFYLTAYVVLAGAELNAEIERRKMRSRTVERSYFW